MPKGIFKRRSMLLRFMDKVSPPTPTGCRLYKLPKGARYGRITIRPGEYESAHVAAAIAFYGPVPKGKLVIHKCDTPACVNPAHLEFGTQKQNIQDCIAKGRRKEVGRNLRKLTKEDIWAIRNSYGMSIKEVGLLFGIHPSAVSSIRNRRPGYWEWLPDQEEAA